MNHTTSRLARIASLTGIMLGAFALSALAGTWTAPTNSPPDGNVDAPINIGYGPQTKQGGVIINSLNAANSPMTYGLWVVNAPIKAGGGLILETRTSDPASPETGRMWLRTDL